MCLSLWQKRETMMRINKYTINLAVNHRLGWNMGHVAAVCGDKDKAQEYLNMGLNPDKGDKFGWTPRQLSIDLHGVDVFEGQECKDKRMMPNQDQDWNMSEVHIASINGKPLQVVECVTKGLDFEKEDVFGYTALDYLELLHGDGKLYKHLISLRKELVSYDGNLQTV